LTVASLVRAAGESLVEKARDDARQHVSLTGREGRVATTQLGALAALRAYGAIALDRVSNGVEQILLAERLRQNSTAAASWPERTSGCRRGR